MIAVNNRVSDVRSWFRALKQCNDYVTDKTGCRVLETIGATFVADEETIFGSVNRDYVSREIAWYRSMSRNVNDIPGDTPTAWKACATPDGIINSNYGHLIWSTENHNQYQHVLAELRRAPDSRRAEMIYTRPSMWEDYNRDGMSDFVCTDSVQYFIRDGKLIACVRMRSNDIWAGYRNDRAWQKHVQDTLASDLNVPSGDLIWHVGSLHCYERNFYLLDGFIKTGRHDMTKDEVKALDNVVMSL